MNTAIPCAEEEQLKSCREEKLSGLSQQTKGWRKHTGNNSLNMYKAG